MPLRVIRRSLSVAVLVTAVFLPAASANTPPTCRDVSAAVQNTDNPDVINVASVRIVADCTDPDAGTTLIYARIGDAPVVGGYVGADPAGFIFIASPGFAGTVRFPYVAHDGTDISNTATVTVTVIGVPPVDPDADRDGVIGDYDECPDIAAPERGDGCPDTDGDGLSDKEDTCPNAIGQGSLDGCPAVVDTRDLQREARRVARRLGRRWDRASVRDRAWARHRITVTVRLPASALSGRGLRVAVELNPVRQPGDGPLGALMFGKGVPCKPGHACPVTLRFNTAYFRPARNHRVRLRVLVSPKDTHGWIGSDAPLDLSPRH